MPKRTEGDTQRVQRKHVGRRKLIQALGVGGTGVVVSRWSKPVLDAVILPVHAQATPPPSGATLFESATLGPTGQGGGTSISDQFLAVRFTLASPATTSAIGLHATVSGTIFAAVVQLSSLSDFPDSLDLSTSDVLGSALIGSTGGSSAEASAPLVLGLSAGTYALIFGGNPVLGATGSGSMPSNNTDIGSPSYFFRNTSGPAWTSGGFSRARMFLIG